MELSVHVKRSHKDSMFRSAFRDRARFLELYNAIKGTNYTLPETEMRETTLDDALILDELNDVSFLIDGKLVVFVEHQTTVNYNMPLRMLIYAGRVMETLMKSRNIYRTKPLEVPDAEFYVIYNGDAEFPEEKILRLSEMRPPERKIFPPNLELCVTIYNIKSSGCPKLLSRSRTLREYELFAEHIQRNYAHTRDREKALKLTVAECREHGIREDMIELFAKGIDNMIFTKFNIDEAKEVWKEEAWEEGMEAGMEKGMEAGIEKGILQTARAMKAKGMDTNTIAEITGLTEDDVLRM